MWRIQLAVLSLVSHLFFRLVVPKGEDEESLNKRRWSLGGPVSIKKGETLGVDAKSGVSQADSTSEENTIKRFVHKSEKARADGNCFPHKPLQPFDGSTLPASGQRLHPTFCPKDKCNLGEKLRVHFNSNPQILTTKPSPTTNKKDPLGWPNPYIPISQERWAAIITVLKSVSEPTYDSLLDATLALFISGKKRLHRDFIRIHWKSIGLAKGFINFMRGKPDDRLVAEIWWSGDEDEIKISPCHKWDGIHIMNEYKDVRKYRFLWKSAIRSNIIRKIFGGAPKDKYATLLIRVKEEWQYNELDLPAGGYLTEEEWLNYIRQYDVNDHYSNWPGAL